MQRPRNFSRTAAAALALAALSAGAAAHPHVLVDAKSEIVFDADGRIGAIRHIWQFDAAFTEYAIQGLDTDGDGTISDAELKPLAQTNVESLAEFGFFTTLATGPADLATGPADVATGSAELKTDPVEAKFAPPTEYWLQFHGGRLTLFYTLPLKEPVTPQARTTLGVFDPEYFVAFTFVEDQPVSLIDAPSGCAVTHRKATPPDEAIMAQLSAVPADQMELPPELAAYAGVLADEIVLSCP